MICSKCKGDKPESDFFSSKKGRGFTSWCKACYRAHPFKKTPKLADSNREYMRERYQPKKLRSYPPTEKSIARLRMNDLVRHGKIIKPKVCPSCGRDNLPIWGTVNDLHNLFDVTWQCSQCNGESRRSESTKHKEAHQ